MAKTDDINPAFIENTPSVSFNPSIANEHILQADTFTAPTASENVRRLHFSLLLNLLEFLTGSGS